MSVYVTPPTRNAQNGRRWPFRTHSYMVADTSLELDDLAAEIGLDCRYKQHALTPREHYDLTASYFERAKTCGAIVASVKEIGRLIARKRAAGRV